MHARGLLLGVACAMGVVGEGDLLGALFPPSAPGTSTVTIEFPGLEPLTDVPVTRL